MESMTTITGFYHVKQTLIEAGMFRCDKEYTETVHVALECFKNGYSVSDTIDELTSVLGLFTHGQRAVMRVAIIKLKTK